MLKPVTGLKLRKEHFGGIACDANGGLMVDLDRAVFKLLSLIVKQGTVSLDDLLDALPALGINRSKTGRDG